MSFGALKMIPSLFGGHSREKGLVGICLGTVKIPSSSPLLKPALGDVGIQSFSSVVVAFFLAVSLLLHELLAVSYRFPITYRFLTRSMNLQSSRCPINTHPICLDGF